MQNHAAPLTRIIGFRAATETIIRLDIRQQWLKSRAGVFVCFHLVPLSLPSISGRCSLPPSVMGILSKMLFNFRKAADGLCEPSSNEKKNPTVHTCLAACTSPSDRPKWRHLSNMYVGLIGMQGEPVGRLTNCLPSETYSQYSTLISFFLTNNASAQSV